MEGNRVVPTAEDIELAIFEGRDFHGVKMKDWHPGNVPPLMFYHNSFSWIIKIVEKICTESPYKFNLTNEYGDWIATLEYAIRGMGSDQIISDSKDPITAIYNICIHYLQKQK